MMNSRCQRFMYDLVYILNTTEKEVEKYGTNSRGSTLGFKFGQVPVTGLLTKSAS